MDEHSHSWCMPTLQSFFQPSIIIAILKIPLSLSPHLDMIIWKEDTKGEFNVWSAYKFIQEHSRQEQEERSLSQELRPLSKDLWKMIAPHKIKIVRVARLQEWTVEQLEFKKEESASRQQMPFLSIPWWRYRSCPILLSKCAGVLAEILTMHEWNAAAV